MQQGGPYKIGQRFGPFTLESYLGSGAFKSVYWRAMAARQTTAELWRWAFPSAGRREAGRVGKGVRRHLASRSPEHRPPVRHRAPRRVSLLVMELLEGESLRAQAASARGGSTRRGRALFGLITKPGLRPRCARPASRREAGEHLPLRRRHAQTAGFRHCAHPGPHHGQGQHAHRHHRVHGAGDCCRARPAPMPTCGRWASRSMKC